LVFFFFLGMFFFYPLLKKVVLFWGGRGGGGEWDAHGATCSQPRLGQVIRVAKTVSSFRRKLSNLDLGGVNCKSTLCV